MTMKGKENAIVWRMAKELGLDLAKVKEARVQGRPEGKIEEEIWRDRGWEATATLTYLLGKKALLELLPHVEKGRVGLTPMGTLHLEEEELYVQPYLPEEEGFFRGRLALLAHPQLRFRLGLDEETLLFHRGELLELGFQVLDPGPASAKEVEALVREYRALEEEARRWGKLPDRRRRELLALAERLDRESPLMRFPSVAGFVYEVYEAAGLLEPREKVGP
jgi:hypothetical protein